VSLLFNVGVAGDDDAVLDYSFHLLSGGMNEERGGGKKNSFHQLSCGIIEERGGGKKNSFQAE
jgi:hypothetical protein